MNVANPGFKIGVIPERIRIVLITKRSFKYPIQSQSAVLSLQETAACRWLANPGCDLIMPLLVDETGWEQRTTGAGEVYYINHTTKTTSWKRPTTVPSPLPGPTARPPGATVLIPQDVAVSVVVPLSGSIDKTVSEMKSFLERVGLG